MELNQAVLKVLLTPPNCTQIYMACIIQGRRWNVNPMAVYYLNCISNLLNYLVRNLFSRGNILLYIFVILQVTFLETVRGRLGMAYFDAETHAMFVMETYEDETELFPTLQLSKWSTKSAGIHVVYWLQCFRLQYSTQSNLFSPSEIYWCVLTELMSPYCALLCQSCDILGFLRESGVFLTL